MTAIESVPTLHGACNLPSADSCHAHLQNMCPTHVWRLGNVCSAVRTPKRRDLRSPRPAKGGPPTGHWRRLPGAPAAPRTPASRPQSRLPGRGPPPAPNPWRDVDRRQPDRRAPHPALQTARAPGADHPGAPRRRRGSIRDLRECSPSSHIIPGSLQSLGTLPQLSPAVTTLRESTFASSRNTSARPSPPRWSKLGTTRICTSLKRRFPAM